MEPADAAAKNFRPVEIAWFELRGGFVRTVVKHDWRAQALAAIAVNRRDVRTVDAVVLEVLVKRLHAHRPDALGDEIPDRIIHHRAGQPGLQAKAIGEIGRDVELAAADVDVAVRGFVEGDDARIETMNERAEGDKIERA